MVAAPGHPMQYAVNQGYPPPGYQPGYQPAMGYPVAQAYPQAYPPAVQQQFTHPLPPGVPPGSYCRTSEDLMDLSDNGCLACIAAAFRCGPAACCLPLVAKSAVNRTTYHTATGLNTKRACP